MSIISKHQTCAVPVIKPAIGGNLGSESNRTRAVGRIGGVVGVHDATAVATLTRMLGPGSQILAAGASENEFVADWDSCWLDGKLIQHRSDWPAILSAGRLAEVQGAFALGWLDSEGCLNLARDAIGERTLYYAPLPQGVVFASSIRALLATGLVARTLNPLAVASYLTYAYVPGRETLVEGVYELLPGEMVQFHRGVLTRTNYWQLPSEQRCEATEEDLRNRLRLSLEDAVRYRLPPGQPVGAFLSGGLDSSLVVALAGRLHDAPIKTYSVSFGSEYANELPFSSLVAEHCQTEHRMVELSPAVVLRYLDETIAMLSDPIGDPLTVPNALLFREAAAEVEVVFNGEGGDPCFGGPKNLPMILSELYDANSPLAREQSYLRAHLKCYDDLDLMLCQPLLDALHREPLESRLIPWFNDHRWQQFVTRLQALNITFKGAHHILPKVDALSTPFGVVPRSPLFDRAVVELSLEIPPQLKLRGSVEKYLLKQAVRDLLPQVIVDRPKSGMLVPVEGWFQGPLLPSATARLLDGLAKYQLVERDYLEKLLAGRVGGVRPRRGAKIWLLLTLEAWLRTVWQG